MSVSISLEFFLFVFQNKPFLVLTNIMNNKYIQPLVAKVFLCSCYGAWGGC